LKKRAVEDADAAAAAAIQAAGESAHLKSTAEGHMPYPRRLAIASIVVSIGV
jgi:hypothetical protein